MKKSMKEIADVWCPLKNGQASKITSFRQLVSRLVARGTCFSLRSTREIGGLAMVWACQIVCHSDKAATIEVGRKKGNLA